MNNIMDYPLLVFLFSFFVLWLSFRIGGPFLQKIWVLKQSVREDFTNIVAPTRALLALLIGFSFAMAVNRYDLRKINEAAEANAIGTEYRRADLLPAADAAKVRALLRDYLDQRVLAYLTRNASQVQQINARTATLQNELWAAVATPAQTKQIPNIGLVIGGMNNVLESQGTTQAGWWNRIPPPAWALLMALAIGSSLLIGYSAQNLKEEGYLNLILPLVLAISFLLIADIDSPHGGLIRTYPHNLERLVETLRSL